MSGKFKMKSLITLFLSQIPILFVTALVILHFNSTEALCWLSSCSVHCFNLSCLLMDFFHSASSNVSHCKFVLLLLLDGCNCVETPPLSQIIRLLSQGMGRRAADLTAPVPVLGVPALIGVHGWRTTAGDGTGGALLHTWGPQCSVGVQTSPGISRPPTNYSVQLTGTLSSTSDNITQISNSYISKKTESKEVLVVTKSDKEKRTILKLKNGESKTKKEVTFKTLGCEASKDVTCRHRGTYCCSKEINTDLEGNVTSIKPKLKSARYTNGSVVDSEAIGGICVDNGEGEPTMSHGKKQTKLQGHYAEKSAKSLLLSATQPFGMQQKICSHCGGRQSIATRVVTMGDRTTTHFQMAQTEQHPRPCHYEISNNTNRDKRITADPHLLYLSEESKHQKIPVCPVHSRSNLVTSSQTQASSDVRFTQPSTILRTKTITVTKAMTETKQDDSYAKALAETLQNNKIPKSASLILTQQMATATKSNIPSSHTYPRNRRIPQCKSAQHNVPQSVCVSVHAVPENIASSLYTTAAGPGNVSIPNTLKRIATFNGALMPMESIPAKVANAKYETQSLTYTAQVNTDTKTTNSPQMANKCPSVSLVAMALQPTHKLGKTLQAAPTSRPNTPPNPAHKPQATPLSDTKVHPTSNVSFIDNIMNSNGFLSLASTPHSTAPHPTLSTVRPQTTHPCNSDQIASTKPVSVAAKKHPIQPQYSKSEPTLHVSSASHNANINTTNPQNSKTSLLSGVAPVSTFKCRSIQTQNTALTNSFNLKNSSPTVTTFSSTLTENQRNAGVSRTLFLQSADSTKHDRELSGNTTNQFGHTQARDSRTQTNNVFGSRCISSTEEHNSTTTPATLSELLNVSKHHQRDTDASHSKSAFTPSNNYGNKFNGNLINRLVVYESKHHENSSVSQVSSLQNCISLIKPSSSCLQGCTNTETEHEGHSAATPPVNMSQQMDTKSEKFALGLSVRHADIKPKFSGAKQTRPSNPAPVVSALINTSASAKPISEFLIHHNSDPNTEFSSMPPPPVTNQGDLCKHTGPECNSMLPPSTMHLASHSRLRSCEGQAIIRLKSETGPSHPQSCLEDPSLAHSHPANAIKSLPPSPQSCKSATLQQRLETVEASLAANKDRITTLLNIIHDLEMSHTPNSR